MYNTEAELGLAIERSGVPRSEITLTTKVVHLDDVEARLEVSLVRLRTDYVDKCVQLLSSGFGEITRVVLSDVNFNSIATSSIPPSRPTHRRARFKTHGSGWRGAPSAASHVTLGLPTLQSNI